jgi:hypothetical protein
LVTPTRSTPRSRASSCTGETSCAGRNGPGWRLPSTSTRSPGRAEPTASAVRRHSASSGARPPPPQVGQLALAPDPGQGQGLGVGGLGVGLGQGPDLERVDVAGEGVAVAVPDRARPVGDQPEAAPVEQAGRAAVDRGRGHPGGGVAAELDQGGVVGQLQGGRVLRADRLVGRVVDPGPLVGEQPAEVAGGLPHPVGVVLDEQRASPPPHQSEHTFYPERNQKPGKGKHRGSVAQPGG